MPLQPGTRLGPYAVTAKIGEGGMGEVWQARDTKLDRDVALKVLPEAFTSDPDRLARFEREAKVLASLNHPNIGSIYGLEEAEGVRALVLELVEGPTLADRIAKGPIPIDEALPIAKQIAEALEAAHEQGVIHRDLKPANIKVKDDGTVKVLDFGLAKAFQPDASDPNLSQSPTISLTAAATQMGMVIGTAAYMAPEQASGKVVDKRADVWAFGVVLYEMLAGTRPFVGDDVSKTLAHVIAIDPDWSALPKNVPPVLGTFLRGCLEKNPRDHVTESRHPPRALRRATRLAPWTFRRRPSSSSSNLFEETSRRRDVLDPRPRKWGSSGSRLGGHQWWGIPSRSSDCPSWRARSATGDRPRSASRCPPGGAGEVESEHFRPIPGPLTGSRSL